MQPAISYLDAIEQIIHRIRATQTEVIDQAAAVCARTIAGGGLVHLFGTGHSRMMVEEMFPRHGSFPGFHSIVELSLTNHNQVVGANGQRQAMFLEHLEGLAAVILRNFVLAPPDCFIIFTNSGVNEVVVEMALEAKKQGLPVIALISVAHCNAAAAKHSSGWTTAPRPATRWSASPAWPTRLALALLWGRRWSPTCSNAPSPTV